LASNTATWKPQASSRLAMAPPMTPVPMMPIAAGIRITL